MKMTNTELLERKDLREQMAGRVEVLDKVKELFLMPKLEMLTTQQVADYFEVDFTVVQKCYQRNQYEINSDGSPLVSLASLKGQYVPTKIGHGKCVFQIAENVTLEVPNRGIRMFSKRAILRIAMLLRDSEVAKEIRTQLLNTFEHATDEQRTADIDEETSILLNLARALTTGTKEDYVYASKNYFDFQNRHIKALEDSNNELAANNKALAGDILKWEERACLNSAIRLIASKLCTNFAFVWGDLYKELRYKHGIGLSQRGNPPYTQYIKEDEWPLVQQSLAAICEEKGLSVSKIMAQAKIKS